VLCCSVLLCVAVRCSVVQCGAVCCSVLQCVAVKVSVGTRVRGCLSDCHCNTLQHTATHCNTLQHTATHCNTLQHTVLAIVKSLLHPSRMFVVRVCSTSKHTALLCNTLHHTAPHCTTLHHTAPHCTTLHHTALHCLHTSRMCVGRLFQGVARTRVVVCCRVLQRGAVWCRERGGTSARKWWRLLNCPMLCGSVLHHTAAHSTTLCNTVQHSKRGEVVATVKSLLQNSPEFLGRFFRR